MGPALPAPPQRRGQAAAISFDEMWTCQQARRGAQRREVWIWTAVAEERDGIRWADFEVGGRSEATFLRLYGRLAEAQRYYSGAYGLYPAWLPPGRHTVGKGGLATGTKGCIRSGVAG